MLCLSIDVGIKNLGYIIYDASENTIKDWNIIELCDKNTNACKADLIDIGKKMHEKFPSVFDIYHYDEIIIENQIGQNAIRMKTLQGMITMYFIEKNYKNIYFWNASQKLKNFSITRKTTYNERKKLSVEITKHIICEYYPDFETHYLSHKKKDDLADCFLQLLDFLKKRGVYPEYIFSIAINLKL